MRLLTAVSLVRVQLGELFYAGKGVENSGRNEIDETCKIQENVSCRFFCVIQIGVRFYRYIEEYADFIFISEFCNLSRQTFVLLVKGLWKTNNRCCEVAERLLIQERLMRQTIQELVERYQNSLYAVAFNVCKNQQDAEDAVQDTFLQYYNSKKEFDSEQHIRAWLIRVAINKAKNINLTFWRKNKTSLEDYMETLVFETPESEHLFETVMGLPEKYRIVIHLFYYEDYSVREIGEILKISESNVKVRLSRGRTLLREILKEEWDDDK